MRYTVRFYFRYKTIKYKIELLHHHLNLDFIRFKMELYAEKIFFLSIVYILLNLFGNDNNKPASTEENSLRFSKERPQNVEYRSNGAVRNTKIDPITHGRFEFHFDSSQ